MKLLYILLFSVLLTAPEKSIAQKKDVTHFVNWLIEYKKLYDIIQFKQPSLDTTMVEFLNQHGLSVTDSHTVRKQLQKPLGRFKPKK